MGCADSQVVREHATYVVDPGSNPAGGPLLRVTPTSLPFPVYPLSNGGNKSVMVDEPVPDQSSPMGTDIIPEDNKLGLL